MANELRTEQGPGKSTGARAHGPVVTFRGAHIDKRPEPCHRYITCVVQPGRMQAHLKQRDMTPQPWPAFAAPRFACQSCGPLMLFFTTRGLQPRRAAWFAIFGWVFIRFVSGDQCPRGESAVESPATMQRHRLPPIASLATGLNRSSKEWLVKWWVAARRRGLPLQAPGQDNLLEHNENNSGLLMG